MELGHFGAIPNSLVGELINKNFAAVAQLRLTDSYDAETYRLDASWYPEDDSLVTISLIHRVEKSDGKGNKTTNRDALLTNLILSPDELKELKRQLRSIPAYDRIGALQQNATIGPPRRGCALSKSGPARVREAARLVQTLSRGVENLPLLLGQTVSALGVDFVEYCLSLIHI